MKKYILIYLILSIRISANAMCTSSGIHVWPTQKNISSNSIFVIEGYSQSQELIRQLNKKCKIYLMSNSERIPVKVLKILKGQFNLTQAILKPEIELTKGETYELYVDNLKTFDEPREFKVGKWAVSLDKDIEKPKWNCEPIFKGQSYTSYGCGPEMYVNFCGSFKDNSPTLIYAKVFDKKNKSSSAYFLTSDKQRISLGHGMCSGEFSFDKESSYEVQFGLMDASGNENFHFTELVGFMFPTEDNRSTEEFNCSCDENSNLLNYSLLGFGIFGVGILGLVFYKKRKRSKN